MKTVFIFLLLSLSLMADITDRVKELESTVNELQNRLADIQNDENDIEDDISQKELSSIKFNGYINSHYTKYSGSENIDEKDGFRLHRFSFIPHQQVNERLRWLGEIEFEDAPFIQRHNLESISKVHNTSGKLFVERIYIQYDINSQVKFRIGRDFAHSTIYSDNHYPSFVLNQLRPLLEREIFPQITDGIELLGSTYINNTTLDYILYYGNGNTHDAHEDINKQDLYGVRVRFSLPFTKLTRLSFAYANGYTSDAKIPSNYKKDAFAIGLEEKVGNMALTAQYARGHITEVQSYTREGFYLRLAYTIGDFTPWVFYEEYDDSSIDDIDTIKQGSVGLAYSFTQKFKVKLEHYRTNDNKDLKTITSFALYF